MLQLLEVRRVLLQPSCRDSVTHQVMRAYSRFVRERLDQASAEPLALQLEDRGRPGEFIPLLREFVEIDHADSLVQLRALQSTEPSTASESDARARARSVSWQSSATRHSQRRAGRPPMLPLLSSSPHLSRISNSDQPR